MTDFAKEARLAALRRFAEALALGDPRALADVRGEALAALGGIALPIAARVIPRVENPSRGRLQLACPKMCSHSVSADPASTGADGNKTWQWDGNPEEPTISPSIDCTVCGRHFTVTKGLGR